jgi:HlyD family type I secretion membrane fusion protein
MPATDPPPPARPAHPAGSSRARPQYSWLPAAEIGIRPVLAVGVGVIVLFFGIFGGWAALAPLGSAAIAPGEVIVEARRKTVQHLEGGIVGEIRVREGDRVAAGQMLIRLDETQPRATLDLLKGRSRAAAALEARLNAERDEQKAIEFPPFLLDEGGDPKVRKILDGQTRIFDARRNSILGQIAILKQRIAQYAEEIKGLKGEVAAETTQVELIAQELEGVETLYSKKLVRKPRLLELRRRQAEIEGRLAQNRARIARVRQNIAETHLRISELRTERINEVVEELRKVQSERFDLQERIRAAEDVLRRTAILAPLAGTVVGLQVHTTGGVIAPGQPLMDIVPSGDRLIVEARVAPEDIDVVHAGLAAKVRLTALNRRNSLPLEGRVLSISADRLVDERTGETYFLARVELLEDPADALGGAFLYPGMAAEVMILTGERTALDYLFTPLSRSLERAFREE